MVSMPLRQLATPPRSSSSVFLCFTFCLSLSLSVSVSLSLSRGAADMGLCPLGGKHRSVPCWVGYLQTTGLPPSLFPPPLTLQTTGASDSGEPGLRLHVLAAQEASRGHRGEPLEESPPLFLLFFPFSRHSLLSLVLRRGSLGCSLRQVLAGVSPSGEDGAAEGCPSGLLPHPPSSPHLSLLSAPLYLSPLLSRSKSSSGRLKK
jgi:hypothetical protein